MQPITGKSLTDIFYSEKAGKVTNDRDFVLVGKEHHDVGRPDDQGYPIRGIIRVIIFIYKILNPIDGLLATLKRDTSTVMAVLLKLSF